MSRRPSGKLPVDRASDQAEKAPVDSGFIFGAEMVSSAPTSPETLDKARRAVTKVHQSGWPGNEPAEMAIPAIADIFGALGLIPSPRERAELTGIRDVPCPTCAAAAGDPCTAEGLPIRKTHTGRQRRYYAATSGAAAKPATAPPARRRVVRPVDVLCPICPAELGGACLNQRNGHPMLNCHEPRIAAARAARNAS